MTHEEALNEVYELIGGSHLYFEITPELILSSFKDYLNDRLPPECNNCDNSAMYCETCYSDLDEEKYSAESVAEELRDEVRQLTKEAEINQNDYDDCQNKLDEVSEELDELKDKFCNDLPMTFIGMKLISDYVYQTFYHVEIATRLLNSAPTS
jgi:hypothetical protein